MVSTRHPTTTQRQPGSPAALRITVVSDASPHRNGVGSYYRDLAGHMRSRRGRISFVSPARMTSSMYLISVPMPGDATQRLRIPNVPVVWNRLRRTRPQVIIVPSPGPFGLLGLCYAARHRIPLVAGLHTDYDRLTSLYWKGPWRHVTRDYLRMINALLVRRSAVVMAANDDLVAAAHRLGSVHVERVGSILPRRYLDRPVRPKSIHVTRILFAGRLAQEKNVPAVLDAAKRLPDLQFRIAGDGPLRAEVQREADRRSNLTYVGWLTRHDLMTELDKSDMLVLPSLLETFGTVALEAAARRCLVLVSARCGLLDWEEFSGSVLRMREEESLATAIARTAGLDPDVRRDLRDSIHTATHRFNDDTIAQWETVLRELTATACP